jgi:uncharacterized protein
MDSSSQSASIGAQASLGRVERVVRSNRSSLSLLVKSAFQLYRWFLSPLLSALNSHQHTCKFIPSCSQYSEESFLRFGIFTGFFLTIKRIFKCHPWSKSETWDPVPDQQRKFFQKVKVSS